MNMIRNTALATGLLATAGFIGSAQAINIDQTLMGQWAETSPSPAQHRRGLNLQYFKLGPELGTVFGIGFIYDNDGNQLWVTGNDPEVRPGDTTIDMALNIITGGLPFGAGAGSPMVTSLGTMSMEILTCDSAELTITTNGTAPDIGDSTSTMSRGVDIPPSQCVYQEAFSGCPGFSDGDASVLVGIERSCQISGTITQDITLTNDTVWVLNGPVFIGDVNSANNTNTLTIEPGTRIVGSGFVAREALIITRGARIIADGVPFAPIVFSSALPTSGSGETASPGDWGGLVINGRAPVNDCPAGDCEGEGNSGEYGGDDEHDSSGILRYVRVQFAGDSQTPDDQLNGIAFQGIGDGTVIEHVQVHGNLDDGVEFFGGTANAKHLVLTDIQDDSLDWTFGWRGKVQYAVIKQGQVADRGIEADNQGGSGGDNDAMPRSQPELANFTIVGNSGSIGLLFRAGTGANLTHSIVTGSGTCLDIDDDPTFAAAGSPGSLTGTLTTEQTLFSCATNFDDDGADPFLVSDFFNGQTGNMIMNPNLDNVFPPEGASYLDGADWDHDAFGDFFDKVPYKGAFLSEAAAWTHGWTEFLDN